MECGGLTPLFLLPLQLSALTNDLNRRKSGSRLPHYKISVFEILARPAPILRRLPNPPACADHQALPAKLAGSRVVSRASPPWSVPPAHRGILAPRDRARSSDPPRNPRQATKPRPFALRAFCFPRGPGNSSSGSTTRRCSPTYRLCPSNLWAAGTGTTARRFAPPIAPAASACPRPCPERAPRKPPVQTAS